VKITLIRHGEVVPEYLQCYNGHLDIGLSSKGEKDAQTLATLFQNSSFDLVYCSDLKRARETLKPFKQVSQAIYTKELREKSWGRHEGKSFDTIVAEDRIEYKDFLQWVKALDGEEYSLYIQRVEAFFLEYLAEKRVETVLVVTHAGVIRSLMSIVKKISLQEAFSITLPYSGYIIFDTKKMYFSEVK